ncbi:dynein regulatory complex protein 8-like [Portunus trituberculatus]|uniref:dynein regulatory complex protein 8-like n=1 Tax=Portunus trituberculatus TaxID=210409 RepID=UPI001E1CF781|nr:dynein regulatory complex protein 8-like [Portunus trituberculatus]
MSLDKKLTEVFTLFQDKDKNVVSVKDVPTIIRVLGLVPSEAEMRKTVAAMVGEESADTVHLAAFLTIAKKLLLDRRFPGVGKEELARALAVLAKEGRTYLAEVHPQPESKSGGMYGEGKKTMFRPAGSLGREELVRLLTCEGEALTQEEAEEMILSLPMKDADLVDLDQYATQLVPPPKFH